jgi:hypothetical protein
VREADLRGAAAAERRFSGQALVEHTPERIEVAFPRRLATLDQLGSQVVRRAQELALGGQAGRVGAPREPEVGKRRRALAVEEHIRGLYVSVQDAPGVQRVEPAPELRGEVNRLVESERPEQAQPHRQGAAGVVGHDQEGELP